MKENEGFEKVMKEVGAKLSKIVDHYFVKGTSFTLVIRHPKDPEGDGIVLSCDKELQKVIKEIEASMMKQLSHRK